MHEVTSLGSLSLVRLTLVGAINGPIRGDFVHAAMCHWLDHDNHQAQRKPFTVRHVATHHGQVTLDISLLHSAALERLEVALSTSPMVRLGRTTFEIAEALVENNCDYSDLLDDATPAGHLTLSLRAPTVFRSGDAQSVMPTPSQVFGHLRSVWTEWAPSHLAPDLDLREIPIFVDRLDGVTKSITLRNREWIGFTGTVGFDLSKASERDRRVLCALALLAPFSGIGANTTLGMGAAEFTENSTSQRPSPRTTRPRRKVSRS